MKQRRQQTEKRNKRPSYEDGKLRDPSIEQKMDPEFRREDLLGVIRKAATRRRSQQ